MRYIPCSESDRKEMLATMGLQSIEQLFRGIPQELRLQRALHIPEALSEPELLSYFRKAAAENSTSWTSFLGAGVYRHFIPVAVDSLISRSEFYTAYTPYQAEVSQGTLQAIFEFQTYITQLTGMEVANASLYDGSTALTEAVLMAHRITGRNRFLIATTVHPEYRAVMATYARNLGIELVSLPYTATGQVDFDRLEQELNDATAAVVVQSPNFFGTIEDTARVSSLAHGHGALSVVGVAEALSMSLLNPPEDADIVAGEAQSLGVPMSFGGPHLGFMATRERFVRQMPGRLVGMGKDQEGRRAFVLTLATREQHIRREKATSNICTNQSLCALMATIYLASLGPRGVREAGAQNVQKTDYAVQQIKSRTRHHVLFSSPRFNEFVLQLDDAGRVLQNLTNRRIVPGLPLRQFYPELGEAILVCVTETSTRDEIDALVEGLQ